MTDERLTFTIPEAAALLGIGTTLTKELIRTGELPSLKIGHRRLVARVDLEAFVEARRLAA